MKNEKQLIQDDDYSFPYHYVPQFRPGYSQTYSWPWGIYYASAMEFILNEIKQLNPSSVADIGTGDGRMVKELAYELPESQVVGIDYSERSIQLAKALNTTLDFRCLDIVNNPPDETFQSLTLIEVFEHIPLDLAEEFVVALRKLIDSNGYLLVTVPHANIPVSAKHFQHFTAESLLKYFSPHFEMEKMVFLDKRSSAVNLIKKLLENQYFILKHWGIRNRIYKYYKKFFLVSAEAQCSRIYMLFRPRY